jgi:pimeloyl-ACP methyl ester carboxylesterase
MRRIFSFANMAQTQQCLLPDGRTLCYAIYGDTDASAPTAFYFHSFPSSHSEASLFCSSARSHSLRIIAASRPGMARSSFQRNRKLLDWPSDVLSLADHLRVSRFAVFGASGGGPYVLACWHSLPRDRLVAAAVVGGIYPAGLGLSGMLFGARLLLWLAPWMTSLVGAGLDFGIGRAARDEAHPERLADAMDQAYKGRPGPDRAAFEENKGGLRDAIVLSTRESLRDGGQGPAWDARLFGSAWGFSLEDLKIQQGDIVLWHGGVDVNVPVAMAEKAATLMPGADLRVVEGEGHCSLIPTKADEIIQTLKRMLTR